MTSLAESSAMTRHLISTRDASRIYKIPERTIRRWHTEGRITDPEVVGGRLMWNHEEIVQMAAMRRGRTRLPRSPACAGQT